ncbi:MAG: FixH family protein [Rhizobiaceae bacterium]
MTQNSSTSFRFTGWHMMACMLAFFGTIIAVNLTMAMLASGSWTGLVVKNSYVASQKFNDRLSEARLQTESGLRSKIVHSNSSVTFTIADRSGTVLKPETALVWIGRPAFEQQDRTLQADCGRDGLCTIATDLAPGPWALRIEAMLQDQTYRRDARLFVGADGKLQVE